MSQIISNAVADNSLLTLGLMSSNSAANLISASSQSLGMSFYNCISNQQQMYIIQQASGVQGRNSMFATTLAADKALFLGESS
ncbi:RebB family R body protein (plasmid) [Photobacterium sp. GJ3]|uniref:RebB family R body protein n=1 Tax=Photobacterium sp. GJ3 TaxID=2829502 RepID=UPI001B8AF620|nr:RebB family R body protein [Photobacterium sp. GJ3]